ncbi:glycosyltransferase [Virgisporangium aurantiacum]
MESDILLVPYGLAGHTNPMAVLGVALRARGIGVTVLAEPHRAGEFTRYGLTTVAPRRWRADAPLPPGLLASGDTGAIFRHLALGSIVDMTLDVEEALTATGATIVVGDVFMPGAGLAAQRMGLPWASIACSPVPAVDSYTMFIDPVVAPHFDAASTLAELGLDAEPGGNLLGRVSPYLHLIPVTPSFAGPTAVARLPAQVRLVGPLVPAGVTAGVTTGDTAGGTGGPARPSIVVAAGSNIWQRLGEGARRQQRYFRIVARALRGMDVDAVVIVPPGLDADTLGPPPAGTRFTGLIPPEEFDALVARCTAVASHGGWGMVSRALVRGVPLVVVPTAIDQPYVANRCQELGLGIAVDPLTAGPADFRAAVETVCGDATYRRNAARVMAELRAAAPARTAASLVAGLGAASVAATHASS